MLNVAKEKILTVECINPHGGGYHQIIRNIVSCELDNLDYVTMDRFDAGFLVYERILTFSGILIERRIPKYACHAKARSSTEDIRQSYEE